MTRMSLVDIFDGFGAGDPFQGYQVAAAIVRRLNEARQKHPLFAEGSANALGVIGAEYDGLVHAVEHETAERQLDEALDLACTAIRFINGEHK